MKLEKMLATAALAVCVGGAVRADGSGVPRNVILFIGDGMSVPQRMVAEEFSRKVGNGPLAMNALPFQATTRTYSASSLVTDSAAAATAIACGVKTYNGGMGVDAEGRPAVSCAEVARDAGRRVGIVTSVTINHATPAGFYAHRANRSQLYEIGLDLVRSGFDLFMGGGLAGANAKTNGVPAADCVGDLYAYAVSNGWTVCEGREGFEALKKECWSWEGLECLSRLDGNPDTPDSPTQTLPNSPTQTLPPVWYRDNEEALPYAIDAKEGGNPRLPELTRFALDYLSAPCHGRLGQSPLPRATGAVAPTDSNTRQLTDSNTSPGFFLMVEGGRIDWAGHGNEAATNLRDLLELDDAVKVALDFQKTHPDTLIIVTGDHETGGMSMGFAGTGYAFYMERLAHQTCSTDTFRERYHALKKREGTTFDDVAALITQCYGLKFAAADKDDPMLLKEKDIESLKRHYEKGGLTDKARRLMQDVAGVGWTSGSHTGLPALTTSVGPGAERFVGLLDNTDISKILKSFYE